MFGNNLPRYVVCWAFTADILIKSFIPLLDKFLD